MCYIEYLSVFVIMLVTRSKTKGSKERNWGLVFICVILIIIGGVLITLSVVNISLFGWWSLLIGLSGLATITAATVSIIENDPVWILLDLILPS